MVGGVCNEPMFRLPLVTFFREDLQSKPKETKASAQDKHFRPRWVFTLLKLQVTYHTAHQFSDTIRSIFGSGLIKKHPLPPERTPSGLTKLARLVGLVLLIFSFPLSD